MELYRQPGSKYWTADFIVDGQRVRKSTKQTTRSKASEVAAEFLRQAQDEEAPALKSRAPRVRDFAVKKFLPFVTKSSLDPDTKRYYATGWRLLEGSDAANWRLDQVTRSRADTLQFAGSGANQNCAFRTLRRMLSLAEDEGLIKHLPRIKLRKENERSATFDAHVEEKFLSSAKQPMLDIFLIGQDAGLRPDEAVRMRWPDVLWEKSLIFVASGKTPKARRYVPLSDRVRAALRARSQGSTSEWVFPSKRSKSGHIEHSGVAKAFRLRREELGITKDLVLYSTRHTFGSDLMDQMGDLTKVGKVLGHSSTRITERYVHPQLKAVASLVNQRNDRRAEEAARHTLRHSRNGERGELIGSC
jgi:integrase